MKSLILGDIHGNVLALEKVLNSYLKEVDQVICHGDVVNYGPWSNECVELLKDINAVTLKGNHEEAFLKGEYPGSNQLVKIFFEKTYADFKYLEEIKNYQNIFHSDQYEIKHTINNAYYYPDSDFSNVSLKINTIIGHSHYAFQKKLENGFTLTNTGSVGQNRKDLTIINFVILDSTNNSLDIKALEYDPLPVIKEMKKQNFPKECIEYYLKKLK